MADYVSQCAWPNLPEPFSIALREAVDHIFSEFKPIGIVATGTIVRGAPQANSDLDLYVVHLAGHRRRVQRFFAGVATEIFVNPPSAVRAYFRDEDRDGRRLTAHMLATGVVVFREGNIIDQLRAEAEEWLAKETRMSDLERISTRYAIASRLEDALDVIDTDEVTARMNLADVVTAMLEYSCKTESGRIPRRKDLLASVASTQAEVARLAGEFFRSTTVAQGAELASRIADRTIGARGFFAWDSGPGPAPDVNRNQGVLRHFLAAIAYRTAKALRDSPPGYETFNAGHKTRTPRALIRHMSGVISYAVGITGRPRDVLADCPTYAAEVERFFALLHELAEVIGEHTSLSDAQAERLLQGPLSDAMAHAGQLALLRRLSGSPIAPEDFFDAAIDSGRLGPDQAAPRSPDQDWPEAPDDWIRPPASER